MRAALCLAAIALRLGALAQTTTTTTESTTLTMTSTASATNTTMTESTTMTETTSMTESTTMTVTASATQSMTTTAAFGGDLVSTTENTTATTTTTLTPAPVALPTVEGTMTLAVSDCTAFAAQENVSDSLAEALATSAGTGISASDVNVTIACSRRLRAARRMSGTEAVVRYAITIPAAVDGASSAPTAASVQSNLAQETASSMNAKVLQALEANNVPTDGVSVTAMPDPVAVTPAPAPAPTPAPTPAPEQGLASRGKVPAAALLVLLSAVALA